METNFISHTFLFIRYEFSNNFRKRKSFKKYIFIQIQNLIKIIKDMHISIGYKCKSGYIANDINLDKDLNITICIYVLSNESTDNKKIYFLWGDIFFKSFIKYTYIFHQYGFFFYKNLSKYLEQ